MERMRPTSKKNRPRAEEPVTRVADLADGLDRVSMGQGLGQGMGHDPLQAQCQGMWGGGAGGYSLEAAPGLPAMAPPFLGEREKSGSTVSALQRLNSSGIMELALSVFGHDSMEAIRAGGDLSQVNSALGNSPPLTPRQIR
jgi:hypothetical protein